MTLLSNQYQNYPTSKVCADSPHNKGNIHFKINNNQHKTTIFLPAKTPYSQQLPTQQHLNNQAKTVFIQEISNCKSTTLSCLSNALVMAIPVTQMHAHPLHTHPHT